MSNTPNFTTGFDEKLQLLQRWRDYHYKDKSRKWDNERKQDTLRILDMITVDLTGDIWNLIEGIDSDMEVLYDYPNKRLNELRDRIERLWGK